MLTALAGESNQRGGPGVENYGDYDNANNDDIDYNDNANNDDRNHNDNVNNDDRNNHNDSQKGKSDCLNGDNFVYGYLNKICFF